MSYNMFSWPLPILLVAVTTILLLLRRRSNAARPNRVPGISLYSLDRSNFRLIGFWLWCNNLVFGVGLPRYLADTLFGRRRYSQGHCHLSRFWSIQMELESRSIKSDSWLTSLNTCLFVSCFFLSIVLEYVISLLNRWLILINDTSLKLSAWFISKKLSYLCLLPEHSILIIRLSDCNHYRFENINRTENTMADPRPFAPSEHHQSVFIYGQTPTKIRPHFPASTRIVDNNCPNWLSTYQTILQSTGILLSPLHVLVQCLQLQWIW